MAAMINCADNTGAKNLYIISVKGIKGRLNRLPSACVGDMVMATVKKDNAGVIVNFEGEMKGSAITGPIDAEARRIHGNKAKVNFPQENSPTAQTRAVKANPQKALPTSNHTLQRPVFNQDFSLMNYTSDDSLGFVEEKPLLLGPEFICHFASMKDQSGFQSFTPIDGDTLCFTSNGTTLSIFPNLDGNQEPETP
ncbi:hypothetical protein IFM89_015530 [Coptis chinensis]|uniref:Ribosomal protein L14 n=1 Tax=Coptis chinensis TaxID=261450 RepID=A0A835M9U8_9MAGN|nr:hypothetical protein IFM89_015530 [Coptis chinensis]